MFSTVTTPNQMIYKIVMILISPCHNSVFFRCGLSIARGRLLFLSSLGLSSLGLTRCGLIVVAPPTVLHFQSYVPSF